MKEQVKGICLLLSLVCELSGPIHT